MPNIGAPTHTEQLSEESQQQEAAHAQKETQYDSDGRASPFPQDLGQKIPGFGSYKKSAASDGSLATICRWIIAHQIGKITGKPDDDLRCRLKDEQASARISFSCML